MKVTGTLTVKVQYEDKFKKLALVVTAGNGPVVLLYKDLLTLTRRIQDIYSDVRFTTRFDC